ncbi:type II toxin-antitoxin system HigA family antitoxin [Dechloromonas sp. H13]|uniref:helix-turn-helix domain-containing protein n=1 Tax=Dechloromonas sp. H13 TaxID=2570193 RepID=UPI0012911E94|nr:helix-turn-helix domain-containing protein [Dechloromonas sp. H13]
MQATQSRFDIRAIQTTWAKFDAMAHIRPIHDEADYDRMVALMNDLLEVVGDDEDHKLAGLLELVGDLVSNYEREHLAIEASEPKDALRFLIEAKGLKQEDLSGIVAQGNLSNILAGRRKISATLAGKLGEFFGVSPALFIPKV